MKLKLSTQEGSVIVATHSLHLNLVGKKASLYILKMPYMLYKRRREMIVEEISQQL